AGGRNRARAQIQRVEERVTLPDPAVQVRQWLDLAAGVFPCQSDPEPERAEERRVLLDIHAVQRAAHDLAPDLRYVRPGPFEGAAHPGETGEHAEQERARAARRVQDP